MNKYVIFATLSIALSSIISCGKHEQESVTDAGNTEVKTDVDVTEAAALLWAGNHKNVHAALTATQALEQNILHFLLNPTPEMLTTSQLSWQETQATFAGLNVILQLDKRDPSLLSLPFSFPFRIAASPIQPGYLDRFGDYLYSGLVYDIGVPLTTQSLIHQHGLTDPEEVVLGLYAIEFMLFGEANNKSTNDYVEQTTLSATQEAQALKSINEIPENRRRTLLELQVKQLKLDIETLANLISNNNASEPHARWLMQPPQKQMGIIRSAFNATITQSLIDIANMQTQATQNENQELPDLPHNPQAQSLTKTARIVALHLDSLLITQEYFSELERQAINASIRTSVEALNTIDFNEQDAESSRQSLKIIYEQLKSLGDSSY